MAATTTPSISKLSRQICRDFNRYTFVASGYFAWHQAGGIVYHAALDTPEALWSLLHEIAHGELAHTTFKTDVALVRCEMAAWTHAATVLAPRYGLLMDSNYIEDHLDTYRQWLHKRSLCPTCLQNGVQQTQNTYSCINCRCLWRANEARVCRLKRTRLRATSRSS